MMTAKGLKLFKNYKTNSTNNSKLKMTSTEHGLLQLLTDSNL